MAMTSRPCGCQYKIITTDPLGLSTKLGCQAARAIWGDQQKLAEHLGLGPDAPLDMLPGTEIPAFTDENVVRITASNDRAAHAHQVLAVLEELTATDRLLSLGRDADAQARSTIQRAEIGMPCDAYRPGTTISDADQRPICLCSWGWQLHRREHGGPNAEERQELLDAMDEAWREQWPARGTTVRVDRPGSDADDGLPF